MAAPPIYSDAAAPTAIRMRVGRGSCVEPVWYKVAKRGTTKVIKKTTSIETSVKSTAG